MGRWELFICAKHVMLNTSEKTFWLGENIWLKLKVAGSSAYLGVGREDGFGAHLARSDDF